MALPRPHPPPARGPGFLGLFMVGDYRPHFTERKTQGAERASNFPKALGLVRAEQGQSGPDPTPNWLRSEVNRFEPGGKELLRELSRPRACKLHSERGWRSPSPACLVLGGSALESAKRAGFCWAAGGTALLKGTLGRPLRPCGAVPSPSSAEKLPPRAQLPPAPPPHGSLVVSILTWP